MRAARPQSSGFWAAQGPQLAAAVVCLVLSVCMIVNTQMGGEAMWFWHATAFHQGVHLYSAMHSPLQPLFVLETDLWMRIVGVRIVLTQLLPLLHACVLLLGCYLFVEQGELPSWQRAIALLGSFTIIVAGHSYRFDDYHVIAEFLIVYALLLLLLLSRAVQPRRQFLRVAALGLIAGLTVTTRVTDGLALLVSATLCLAVVVPQRKLASVAAFLGIASLTVLAVVHFTGDSFSVYLSSTVFRAAASKGGSGSLALAPLKTLRAAPSFLKVQGKLGTLIMAGFVLIAVLVRRFWKVAEPYTVAVQIALAAPLFFVLPERQRFEFQRVMMLNTAMLWLMILLYVACLVVVFRFIRARLRHQPWDTREVLYLLPLAEWASYSAGAAAEPLTNYYAPLALFLLLIVVLQPLRRLPVWVTTSFYGVFLLLGITCITGKVLIPYSWQNYIYRPMFQNRHFYRHPVYGAMYIDKDLLQFSERVCTDIHAGPAVHPELLSLPYPYPNLFCDTPPWHNYVQTFFDTSSRGTIEHLEQELNTAPPQWIVYQRQLNILKGAEVLYNHGQPIAQRDLDQLIFGKLASGQWTLVDRSDYLGQGGGGWVTENGGGWYIIRTRP